MLLSVLDAAGEPTYWIDGDLILEASAARKSAGAGDIVISKSQWKRRQKRAKGRSADLLKEGVYHVAVRQRDRAIAENNLPGVSDVEITRKPALEEMVAEYPDIANRSALPTPSELLKATMLVHTARMSNPQTGAFDSH